jgi:glycosyltransferase involved in cell wall biosynthesis
MDSPAVSVVMPVYNAEAYLAEAINSILMQRFTDFELIIINDGSKDKSGELIKAFNDPRISYLENDGNRGVIFTLNRGIQACKAPLIARMDADDISLPDRLAKQYAFMQAHPNAAVLASKVELINELGKPIGFWKEDNAHSTLQEIREFLPVNNCIAHPSIMARTSIMKEMTYMDHQPGAEDYDLWLRICARGLEIHKIPEVLLKHRILPSSVTRGRQDNVFFRLAATKGRFVWQQLGEGKISEFMLTVAMQAIGDMLRGTGKQIKKTFRAA